MAAGIGALKSAVGRIKSKIPGRDRRISVVFEKRDGTIDWPPEDRVNKGGVLVVPEPFTSDPEGELLWELYCANEV
ncbi:hypothetical protein [Desulforhopalus sp. 52FAK]